MLDSILNESIKLATPLWAYHNHKDFVFAYEEEFENTVLPYLKEHIEESPDAKLRRNTKHTARGMVGEDTLDAYYVNLINDTLCQVRKGQTAYIFSLRQVADLLRFEKKIDCTLHDGIFYVYRE